MKQYFKNKRRDLKSKVLNANDCSKNYNHEMAILVRTRKLKYNFLFRFYCYNHNEIKNTFVVVHQCGDCLKTKRQKNLKILCNSQR